MKCLVILTTLIVFVCEGNAVKSKFILFNELIEDFLLQNIFFSAV